MVATLFGPAARPLSLLVEDFGRLCCACTGAAAGPAGPVSVGTFETSDFCVVCAGPAATVSLSFLAASGCASDDSGAPVEPVVFSAVFVAVFSFGCSAGLFAANVIGFDSTGVCSAFVVSVEAVAPEGIDCICSQPRS